MESGHRHSTRHVGRFGIIGAAPAATAEVLAGNSPETDNEAGSMINVHMLRVWAGLSPPERTRAGELIAQLPARDQMEWLAELARLTCPKRSRALALSSTRTNCKHRRRRPHSRHRFHPRPSGESL